MLLSELTASARRVAVVGLAKNTGKTEALAALLRELDEQGRVVGVTSVGRDGESYDVIDARIEKPRLLLCSGSVVSTTDALARASAVPHELLCDTGIRTPLGRVQVIRLRAAGAVEVAGPSAARDVRMVADAMLDYGAEQVLVDGAIDRRAASSPAVTDGLILATGAVLDEEIGQVVALTREAVELVCLPKLPAGGRVRELAFSGPENLLVGGGGEATVLHPRLGLSGTAHALIEPLRAYPRASHLILRGALCEPFLQELLSAAHGRQLELVVADSTKVFLSERSCEWYRSHGFTIRVLASTRLCGVTINPCAPRSHSFDSVEFQRLLEAALRDIAVLDVRRPAGTLSAMS